MKYWIATGYSIPTLMSKVNERIESGWVPIGGVCMLKDGDAAQAMVLMEEKKGELGNEFEE